MSVDELNNYIDNIARKYILVEDKMNNTETLKITSPDSMSGIYYNPIVEIKAAWLAAAQIAKLKGYTCAATLVEHSVLGKNYYEQSDIFSQKIKSSNEYKSWMNKDKKPSDLVFSTGDLFYALHKVKISFSAVSSQGAMVHINDKFDFELDSQYSDLFTSLVNNWAWLCQHSYVLTPIDVDIYFTY